MTYFGNSLHLIVYNKLKVTTLISFILLSTIIISCVNKKDINHMNNIDFKVEQQLSKMTLEEKVGQMTQITLGVLAKGGRADDRPEPVVIDIDSLTIAIKKYKIGSILNTVNNRARTLEFWGKTINQIQEISMKELGIPILFGIDAIHGNTYTAKSTLFPQEICQAASFNPELVKQLNGITTYEMRASNIPWTFAPVLDMGRDARDARFWETYGEDVFLCQKMGIAAVEGIQGDKNIIDEKKGAACLKHFLAYNSNSGKDRNPLDISVRELLERHAPSFQAAIDAGAKSIMVSSGIMPGVAVHANYEILTQLT